MHDGSPQFQPIEKTPASIRNENASQRHLCEQQTNATPTTVENSTTAGYTWYRPLQ